MKDWIICGAGFALGYYVVGKLFLGRVVFPIVKSWLLK